MFQVFENGKPADSANSSISEGLGWDNSIFNTWEEAVQYANEWLGIYKGVHFQLNKPVDYGYGSTIEIREIK